MTEVESKSPAPAVSDPPASEQANGSSGPEPPATQFASQGPSGQPFPPPNFAFYNYPPGQAPPGDGGNQDANAQSQPNGNGQGPPAPYPPGMIFPYPYPQPPPGYMPVSMSGMPLPGALVKPKRKQVKMACTNCAAACKRCDVARPCERCIKYGLSDTCRDGQRKERKKGFKRGPYNKRKRQEEREAHEWEAAQNNPNGEWTPNGPGPFPGPPQQGGFPPPPEGYYPAFYALPPPPPGPGPQLVPVTQSGSSNENPAAAQADGNADQNANGEGDHPQVPQGQPGFPPPHAQFVYPPLPPGSYPPFGYPFPNHAQQPQQPQPQPQPETQSEAQPEAQPESSASAPTPSSAKRAAPEEDAKNEDEEDPPTPPRKKRTRRTSDGEWPGASKRTAKSKVENSPPTRRSTRRQQHQPDQANGRRTERAKGANMAPANGGMQAPENIVLQHHVDPVLTENAAAA